jgi:NADH:ubiquinone reductase (H+-translocating)
MTEPHHKVVIIGGGFGGLQAARALKRAPVQVTLVDRRNFHLFQPLLYQVAVGGLSPANIASPLRAILKRQRNVQVLLGEVVDFDVANRRVLLSDGALPYDTLIVAAGAGHHYFGHPEWERHAPSLKTVEDATGIRRRILLAFEEAEREPDPDRRRGWMTFVIAGGGPTGVELAGAIAELSRHTLRKEFRAIDPAAARILLVEGLDRVLPTYPPSLSAQAAAALSRLGVVMRTRTMVRNVNAEAVTLCAGDCEERIDCRTVLWAAGVEASPLAPKLARAAGATTDRANRIVVGPDCSVPGHPEILVIGDMAHFRDRAGQPLPGLAQTAIQQGRYAARYIDARLHGKEMQPFSYRDYGTMATIGRAAAVADLGWVRFAGYPAWLAWLFIHLMSLVGHQNRLLVALQWGWNYFTRNRSARLITGLRRPSTLTYEPGSPVAAARDAPVGTTNE